MLGEKRVKIKTNFLWITKSLSKINLVCLTTNKEILIKLKALYLKQLWKCILIENKKIKLKVDK